MGTALAMVRPAAWEFFSDSTDARDIEPAAIIIGDQVIFAVPPYTAFYREHWNDPAREFRRTILLPKIFGRRSAQAFADETRSGEIKLVQGRKGDWCVVTGDGGERDHDQRPVDSE